MIGMPATRCATTACACPATIASTRPCGSARATSKISAEASHDDRSAGSSNRLQRPPACAVTRTTVAPRARSFAASLAIVGVSGADAQSADVRRQCRAHGDDGHDADDADLHAGRFDEHRWLHVRPFDRPARGIVDQVCGQEWISGLSGACLERAAWIVSSSGRPFLRAVDGKRAQVAFRPVHVTEVELVIADSSGGVAERVERIDDHRPFAQVRFDASLKGIAGVEQHDAAALGGADRPEIADIPAEQSQPALAEDRQE